MCECKSEIEEKIKARFIEQEPEATEHHVQLTGYALIFGNNLQSKGCMPFKMTATYPLKKGGSKAKSKQQNMLFTYCPFCGEEYEATNTTGGEE